MPIQLKEAWGGIVDVHVSGKLAAADYEHFVPVIFPDEERPGGRHSLSRVASGCDLAHFR